MTDLAGVPQAASDLSDSPQRGRAIAFTAASFVGAQAIALWLLVGPLADQPWWQGFRNYFSNDQLSYAAIATTIANGTFSPVEPLTETGVSFYPSGWYYVIGTVSLITGAPVYALWQVLGLLAVAIAIAALGFLGYRLTRHPIAPLLPGLALATGTFSTFAADYWFTPLGYHAVIWGPYGTLFTLNAESIGVMTVAVVFTWLLVSAMRQDERRRPFAIIVIAAAILGLLANVQTYSFFTGTSLAVAFLACFALITIPSRSRLIATVLALAAVLVLGHVVAGITGPLPLFGLLLLSTLPANWPLLRQHARLSIIAVIAFVVAASPQVIRTALGLITGDDFLGYRQASTEDLGIDLGPALLAALPLLAIAVALLIAAVTKPRTTQGQTARAALAALATGVAIMSTNDLWGFDQEPYRFWLQYSIVGLLSLSTLLPWAWSRRKAIPRTTGRTVIALTAVAAVLWSVAFVDVLAFRDYARVEGLIAAEDERGKKLQALVGPESGIVLSSACLDPQQLRLITGAPVVFFNRGLAWPEKKDQFDQLLDPGRVAVSDPAQLAGAGVTYVITDSACESEWSYQDARIQPERIEPYSGGTFTLWRVAPVQQ